MFFRSQKQNNIFPLQKNYFEWVHNKKVLKWKSCLLRTMQRCNKNSGVDNFFEAIKKGMGEKCYICGTDKPTSCVNNFKWQLTNKPDQNVICYECDLIFEGGYKKSTRDKVKQK